MKNLRTRRAHPEGLAENLAHTRTPPEPLGTAHTVLRWNERPSPYPGWVVACGDRHLMAIEEHAQALWENADAMHVFGARDVLRTRRGILPLVEPCVTRLSEWMGEHAVASGEVVTIALSVLRGLGEIGVQHIEITGQWWLTRDARPVFVVGEGEAVPVTVQRVLEDCVTALNDRAMQRLCARIAGEMGDPLAALSKLSAWEAELLELAAPRALRLGDHRAIVPDVGGTAVTFDALALGAVKQSETPQLRRRVRDHQRYQARARPISRAGGAIQSSLAPLRGLLSDASRLILARLKVKRPHPVAIAGATAVAVLGVGLFWPTGPSEAEATKTAATAAPMQITLEQEVPLASGPAQEEPSMHPLQESSGEAGMPLALLEELAGVPAGEYSFEIVEQYGHVMVGRLMTAAAGLIVVLEREDENWLLRDAYAVAEQPVREQG